MLSLVKEPLTPHWDNGQTWNKNKRCGVESEADIGIYLEGLEAYTNKVSDCRSLLNSALAPPLKRMHPAGSRGMLCCASTHSGVSGFQHRFKGTTLNPDLLALISATFSQEYLHWLQWEGVLDEKKETTPTTRQPQFTHLQYSWNAVVSGFLTKKPLVCICLTYRIAFVHWPKYTLERKG